MLGSYDYPRSHRIFELLSIGAFLVLAFFATRDSIGGLAARTFWPTALVAVLAAIAGYAVADVLSGIVHFLLDNFGSPTTPVIGQKFVKPFRDHHIDPLEMTRGDFVAVNADNIFICLPVLIPMVIFLDAAAHPAVATFLLALLSAVVMTNQLHKWAHLPTVPRVVHYLQAHGIVLSREHHREHHTGNYDRNYCITWGRMDAVLNRAVGGWHRPLSRRRQTL